MDKKIVRLLNKVFDDLDTLTPIVCGNVAACKLTSGISETLEALTAKLKEKKII